MIHHRGNTRLYHSVKLLSDGSKIDTYMGEVKFYFDPTFEFELLDMGGNPTGQLSTGLSVYQGIHSYLMAKVFERDALQIVAEIA